MDNFNISNSISGAYNDQYKTEDVNWRRLGAKYKAMNIIKVSGDRIFEKVLECGAGDGSILYYLQNSEQFKQLNAIEISDSGIDKIKQQSNSKLKTVIKFDGYNIPFEDKYFDLVYCSHVIEHVEHPRILLREIKRVSKYQIFEIPLDYKEEVDKMVEYFLGYGHINIYTPSLFKFLLKSEGYEIENEIFKHPANEIFEFIWTKGTGILNFKQKINLRIIIFKRIIKRILWGKKNFKEYGFSSYTCLAKGTNDIHIF